MTLCDSDGVFGCICYSDDVFGCICDSDGVVGCICDSDGVFGCICDSDGVFGCICDSDGVLGLLLARTACTPKHRGGLSLPPPLCLLSQIVTGTDGVHAKGTKEGKTRSISRSVAAAV